MKQDFVSSWKHSTQPRKQRKYVARAPLHTQSRFLHGHLSKELREKHHRRSLRIRSGDKVRILRGQFAGTEGKVEAVNTKTGKLHVAKAELPKKDGSKAKYPIRASNVLITELNLEDKKRIAKTKIKEQTK